MRYTNTIPDSDASKLGYPPIRLYTVMYMPVIHSKNAMKIAPVIPQRYERTSRL